MRSGCASACSDYKLVLILTIMSFSQYKSHKPTQRSHTGTLCVSKRLVVCKHTSFVGEHKSFDKTDCVTPAGGVASCSATCRLQKPSHLPVKLPFSVFTGGRSDKFSRLFPPIIFSRRIFCLFHIGGQKKRCRRKKTEIKKASAVSDCVV